MNNTEALGRVDALYGTGTVCGWYFTLLSCIVSWTLHPEKRHKDTISPDLVVSLTLPLVAVIHIISQMSGSQLHYSESFAHAHIAENLQRTANAVEAPLVIIEAFMNIAAAMFMMAVWSISIRRALVVGIVGLLCFVTDSYAHSTVYSMATGRLLSRNFIADSVITLTIISVILGVLFLVSLGITLVFFYNRHREDRKRIRRLEEEGENLEEQVVATQLRSNHLYSQLALKDSWSTKYITAITILFLPMSFIASFLGLTISDPVWHPKSLEVPSIGEFLFPRSRSSWKDLDQRVAILGGLTALGFSLYSLIAIRYNQWQKNHRRRLEQREQNNIRLRQILQSGRPTIPRRGNQV